MSFVEINGNTWFHEENSQWPGMAMSLQVEKVLEDVKTKYQHLIVFLSSTFGNVLVLDGVIQYTERDECAYQEMISHCPLFSHPNPERVMVVGGGDGGCIREVLKHKSVKEVVICEIDEVVIEMGKKYFPDVRDAWSDPRLRLVCMDANIEMKNNADYFDVIISDTSDPVGPAADLFEMPFYKAMYDALRAGGRVSTQAESMWLHEKIIGKLVKFTSQMFEHVGYITVQIPTYPGGQIGVLQCAKPGASPQTFAEFQSSRPVPDDMKLKYYSQAMHASRWVVPKFLQDTINGNKA